MSDVRVSEIRGNSQLLDGGSMFGNAPRPVWERWIPPDSIGRIPLACRALLIEIENQKILCETGIGAFFEPKLADRFGVQSPNRHMLLESLRELDLSEDDIDVVILSHLHFDHAGGLLPTHNEIQVGRKRLLFPKAKYVVGKEAWERALHPHARDKASFIPGLTDMLSDSGRLQVIESLDQAKGISPNLDFFVTNGHTPGQMHTVFRGKKTSIVFAGDLIPGQPWVHLPITMGYDRYPELLIDEKRSLYEKIVPNHWWVFYTHDPKWAMSHIKESSNGRFEPEDSQTDVRRMAI